MEREIIKKKRKSGDRRGEIARKPAWQVKKGRGKKGKFQSGKGSFPQKTRNGKKWAARFP